MSRLAAITTNERLLDAGLLDEWDRAVSERDRMEMIALLGRVDLADQADWIADQILKKQTD